MKALWALVVVAACSSTAADGAGGGPESSPPVAWNARGWRPPSLAAIPNDSLGAAVRRGLAIMRHTADSLPGYVGGNVNCMSCHLDNGLRPNAMPLPAVAIRYPKYVDRSGVVVSMADRVNFCMTRSLSGWTLPDDSRQMQDMIAYLMFVSTGVPVAAHIEGEGLPVVPALPNDSARGRRQYASRCARCHGSDGSGGLEVPTAAGSAIAPALWGARSFSIGASMARMSRATSFIRYNMPLDSMGVLDDQTATDVAAFITSLPRPDLPSKERDWPLGDAPKDVPYATRGHAAYHPPALLPRRHPAGAIVTTPTPAVEVPVRDTGKA